MGLLAAGLFLAVYSSGLAPALVSWALIWVGSHCPAHYLVGRLCGIRFTHYVIAPSALSRSGLPAARLLLLPGLRVYKPSLRGAGCVCVAAMYSSGAVSSMSLPWLPVLTLAYGGAQDWVVLALLQALNVAFTLYASPRWGDLRRARLALRGCRGRG